MIGWLGVKACAQYCGVSTRTIRSWLVQGLRHSRSNENSGRVLIKVEWVDSFLEAREVSAKSRADEIVEKTLKDFRQEISNARGE